jgi:hypothetical protein
MGQTIVISETKSCNRGRYTRAEELVDFRSGAIPSGRHVRMNTGLCSDLENCVGSTFCLISNASSAMEVLPAGPLNCK